MQNFNSDSPSPTLRTYKKPRRCVCDGSGKSFIGLMKQYEERKAEIAEKDEEIAQKDEEIEQKEEKLAEKDEEVYYLKRKVAGHKRMIQKLCNRIVKLEKEKTERDRYVKELEEHIAEKVEHNNEELEYDGSDEEVYNGGYEDDHTYYYAKGFPEDSEQNAVSDENNSDERTAADDETHQLPEEDRNVEEEELINLKKILAEMELKLAAADDAIINKVHEMKNTQGDLQSGLQCLVEYLKNKRNC